MKIIETRNLVKRFPIGDGEFTALNQVNLSFNEGEFAGLIGPSGSGKTTLLNIIGSLDVPTEGDVVTLGHSISGLSHKMAADLRNKSMGFIFQGYNLLPVYSVYENVEFALILQGVPSSERKTMVMQALEWVGLAGMAKKRPDKLSGGEGQRVAIARAMVKRPKLVLADEPTANLDAKNAHAIIKTMKTLNQELGTTFLFATHYLEDGKVTNEKTV